jgi:hypothetical protein
MSAASASASLAAVVARKGWASLPPLELGDLGTVEADHPGAGGTGVVIDLALRMGCSRRHRQLEAIGGAAAAALTAGQISHAEYAALASAKRRRHEDIRQRGQAHAIRYGAPRRPSYDRTAAKDRRRGLLRLGLVPDQLGNVLTPGEEAVATRILQDIQVKGYCDKSNAELAQLAGCCERLVMRTKKQLAVVPGFKIMKRPHPGRRHDTTIIRIDRDRGEWLRVWLRDQRRPERPAPLGERPTCVHHRDIFTAKLIEGNGSKRLSDEAVEASQSATRKEWRWGLLGSSATFISSDTT